jgi:CRP-like cAMP-binding protein
MNFHQPWAAQRRASPPAPASIAGQRSPNSASTSFAARAMICLAGAPSGEISRVRSGEALLTMGDPGVSGHVVGLIGPGDLLGLSFGGKQICNVRALSPVTLEPVFDPADPLMIAGVIEQLHASFLRSARLAGLEASARLADFFVSWAEKRLPRLSRRDATARGLDLHVPLKRFELASYLCMSGETLSRELKSLRTARLIETPNPHTIRLLDFDALRRWGA